MNKAAMTNQGACCKIGTYVWVIVAGGLAAGWGVDRLTRKSEASPPNPYVQPTTYVAAVTPPSLSNDRRPDDLAPVTVAQLASAQEPKDGPMVGERLKRADVAITQARAKLEEAETGKDPKRMLQQQIVLSSWLFLSGELCADDVRGAGRLVTTANDRFDEAGQLYKTVERALKGKPDLEKEICADETVAMHLDIVRVRKDAIDAHTSDSRKLEKARLNTLRELARSYRDCSEKFSTLQTYLLLQDFDKARAIHEELQVLLKGISDKAIDLRGLPKDDYYLMGDETTDIDQPTGAEYRIYSQSFAPQTSALTAWLALRGAEVGTGPIDTAQVQAAIARANEAIKLAGANENNQLLGHYILGVGYELAGLAETRKDLTGEDARRRADASFAKAKDSFKKFSEIAGKKDDAAKANLSKLMADVAKRQANLEKPELFLQRATDLLSHGQSQDAADVLKSGLEFHRNPQLWAARAQTRLWAHHPADQVSAEFEDAVAKGVFPATDSSVGILRGEICLTQRDPAGNQARTAETHFREALKLVPADDAAGLARVRALIAYAIVMGVSAKEDPTQASHRLDDALTLADRARSFLTSPNGARNRNNAKATDLQSYVAREALALDYQALGFIATRRLPNYQATAAQAFGDALDEIGRLPFSVDQKPFGAPLFEALRSRPENAGELALWAEQNKRLALTHVARGLVASQLGDSAVATKQIAEGLERWKDDQQLPTKPTESIDPLLETRTRSELVALRVLNDLTQGKKNKANIREVADAAVKELEAEKKRLESSGSSESPLSAYVRGLAREDSLVSFGLKAPANHDALKEKCIEAYKQAKAILESPTTRERFPAMIKLCDDAIARLEKSDSYISRAKQAREEFRLTEAEEILRDGLARHPKDTAMWTQLVEVRIDRLLAQKTVTPEQANEVVDSLSNVPEGFGRFYGEGLIHEHMRNWAKAATAFEKAEKAAIADKNDEARIRGTSKLVESRIRLGVLGD